MAAWSRLLLSKGQSLLRANTALVKTLPKNEVVRCMSEHRTMQLQPSRWQWHKTKDWFHFYFMLGAIPVSLIIFCANVFVGPATLEEIPEGYTPKHWEYYRSPITRFFARYCFPNPQQEYEKGLHYIHVQEDARKLRLLSEQVLDYINSNQDYNAFYYRGIFERKYIHDFRKEYDRFEL